MVLPLKENFSPTFTGIWFYDYDISDEIKISMKQHLERTFHSRHTFNYLGDLFQYLGKEDRVTSLCLIISSNVVEYLMGLFKSDKKC